MSIVKLSNLLVVMLALVLLSFSGDALRTFSGDTINIDDPIEDDIFAAGDVINVNAAVDSATVAGGTVNINAPVKGDVIAAGGQVFINSDVGGKVVAAGGTVNLGGDIGTNLAVAGGQVIIQPDRNISKDALIAGENVVNSGNILGTLTVYASSFNNSGSAGRVDYHMTENNTTRNRDRQRDEAWAGFGLFTLLSLIGYFILGIILVRYLPAVFQVVDEEIRDSTLLKTVIGFVIIIASFFAILIVAITVVGIPIALLAFLLLILALMLSGTFVAFSLGRWICRKTNLDKGDLICFTIGFVILNVIFLIPFLGWLVSLISMSLGLAGLIYAARRFIVGSGNKLAVIK